MVMSWLLNSISEDISESFLFAISARDLCLEIEARFGQCNGSLTYQLQKEINTSKQGKQSVIQYLCKVKRLWDELQCLEPVPSCNCGAARTISDPYETRKIIQFLLGSNDIYDYSKNHLIDPLPPLHNVYGIIRKVEKVQQYGDQIASRADITAKNVSEFSRVQNTSKGSTPKKRPFGKSEDKYPYYKEFQLCELCRMTGDRMGKHASKFMDK